MPCLESFTKVIRTERKSGHFILFYQINHKLSNGGSFAVNVNNQKLISFLIDMLVATSHQQLFK